MLARRARPGTGRGAASGGRVHCEVKRKGKGWHIQRLFAAYFAAWSITLPDEALAEKHAGSIQQAGWIIRFLWGADERGEYLDFYATHRMTNDRHVRLRESGEVEDLPAYWEHIIHAADAAPGEIARVEREFYEHNRAVAELLRRKGFA